MIDLNRASATKTTIRLSALALAALLAACGGGGGDPSMPSNTETTPVAPVFNPGNFATSVPAATYIAGSVEKSLFDELNLARLNGGFGMLKQLSFLDKAATNHANYVLTNFYTSAGYSPAMYESDPNTGLAAHAEYPDKPGFTGLRSTDRKIAAGGAGSAGEVIAFNPHPECVSVLLNTVFHRDGLLDTRANEIGIGLAFTPPFGRACVINTGSTDFRPVYPTGWVGIYPGQGQANVPLGMGGEAPDPAPEIPADVRGSPVTIYTQNPITLISTFTLTPEGSSQPIVSKLLTSKEFPGYIRSTTAHILPVQKLLPNTRYTAVFRGTTSNGALEKTWTFTTKS
jgi:uncharacterized protein YkwD